MCVSMHIIMAIIVHSWDPFLPPAESVMDV